MFRKSSRMKIQRFTSRVLRCLRAFKGSVGRTITLVCTTSLNLSQEGNLMFSQHPPSRNNLRGRCFCDSDTGQIRHSLNPEITLKGLFMMSLLHAVLTKLGVLVIVEVHLCFLNVHIYKPIVSIITLYANT